jgi:hypothetical protein
MTNSWLSAVCSAHDPTIRHGVKRRLVDAHDGRDVETGERRLLEPP